MGLGRRNESWLPGELLINFVKSDKPKMLKGLNQKVYSWLISSICGITRTQQLSEERQSLTRQCYLCGTWQTHISPERESNPQGKPIGVWAWDGRESECRPVAGRIRIERKRHHPMRKHADFYLVLLYKRIYRTFEGGKANEC